ncbi:MAG: sulfatase-like hydrolase/transferase [Rikenellaceae bacterium]
MDKNLQSSFIAKAMVGVAVSQPLFAITACTPKEAVQEKPNIVVVLCDDLGYGDLGCFGHEYIETPTLDQMAADGIKLTNFYSTAAVSSPSRAGLLTGRNPNKAGFYDFIPGPKYSEDCRDMVQLQAHEITIPALLKTAGYSTCLAGKWHCNSYFNSPKNTQPNDFGFDHWFATHNNASPSHKNPANFVRNGEAVGELIGFSSEVVVNEAINWLESRKEETNPFYLHVTFHEPHENIASPDDLVEKHLPHSINREQAEYFANVENMDRNLGRLVEYLKENYGSNTLIVFSSDNGPETLGRYSRAIHSYGTTGGHKGMKLWTNDGGIHVPGIMTWLGKDTFKGETDAVVSALDYLPSFCELAGVALPERNIDGESMLAIFEKGEFTRESHLMWVFYDALNEQAVALRDGDWKIMCSLYVDGEILPNLHNLYPGNYEVVKNAELRDFSLYNLKEDRYETTDVSEANPEIFAKMKAKVQEEYNQLMAESHVWVRPESEIRKEKK